MESNAALLLKSMDLKEAGAQNIAQKMGAVGVGMITKLEIEEYIEAYPGVGTYIMTFEDHTGESYWMTIGGTQDIGELRRGDRGGEVIAHGPYM